MEFSPSLLTPTPHRRGMEARAGRIGRRRAGRAHTCWAWDCTGSHLWESLVSTRISQPSRARASAAGAGFVLRWSGWGLFAEPPEITASQGPWEHQEQSRQPTPQGPCLKQVNSATAWRGGVFGSPAWTGRVSSLRLGGRLCPAPSRAAEPVGVPGASLPLSSWIARCPRTTIPDPKHRKRPRGGGQ